MRWAELRPAKRARLVAPGGGSMLLAVRGDGGPFTAWSSVFARVSERIRDWYEPRFPHVSRTGCGIRSRPALWNSW